MFAVLNRKPVEELLERLFSTCDTVTSAKLLKHLCLNESIDFKPMHSHLQFTAGDCGGVKVVVSDDSRLVIILVIGLTVVVMRVLLIILLSPCV